MTLASLERRDREAERQNAKLLGRRILDELGIEPTAVLIARSEVITAIADAVDHGRQLAIAEIAGLRRCKFCGCTEHNACDGGCWWVAKDVCSSCADLQDVEHA